MNVLEDPALLAEIVERGIGRTVWPISNSFVRGSAWDGATKRLLDAGVLVSVNSDDPAYFDGDVTECFLRVHQETPLSIAEVRTLARNAFEIAWLPTTLRARFLDEVDAPFPTELLGRTADSAGGSLPGTAEANADVPGSYFAGRRLQRRSSSLTFTTSDSPTRCSTAAQACSGVPSSAGRTFGSKEMITRPRRR